MKKNSRLKEIKDVIFRHKITKGISPEKLRVILEELGPTYIKLGQIMSLHSDILSKEYCDELAKLNSDVCPMTFEEVEDVINSSYCCDWHEIFKSIEKKPLGAASIAQVHKAQMPDGSQVIIKVQRKGVYSMMAGDIALMRKLAKLMPPVSGIRNMIDLNQVIDELWSVSQEEMNFMKEASNMEEFARYNRDIAYIYVPKIYKEYTTNHVLVMEYVDGVPINDRRSLLRDGYDLNEIGSKLVNNFIMQIMEYGFFHADPHPGNVKVRDGKIVWLDMGMMGRLSDKDRQIMNRGVMGIALNDIRMVENAILDIGNIWGKTDREQLYEDLKKYLDQYGNTSMGSVDLAAAFSELMDIMKRNKIGIPRGMTMLARGLAHIEGILSDISPEINMVDIAAARMTEEKFKNLDFKKEIRDNLGMLVRSVYKGVEMPSLLSQALRDYMSGQAQVKLKLESTDRFNIVIYQAVRNLVIGLWVMALMIASSIVCLTDMKPKLFGIPAIGAVGYLMAFAIVFFVIVRFIYRKLKNS